jgi:soluble lytic murein transglycosylase
LLEEPSVSVPLGAAYLALLSDRFRDPAVVLAAYNAGPRQAARWARDRGGVPLDEWVEGIPFRETRRYVKNVLADAAVYRSLWRGGTLSVDGSREVPRPAGGVGF